MQMKQCSAEDLRLDGTNLKELLLLCSPLGCPSGTWPFVPRLFPLLLQRPKDHKHAEMSSGQVVYDVRVTDESLN